MRRSKTPVVRLGEALTSGNLPRGPWTVLVEDAWPDGGLTGIYWGTFGESRVIAISGFGALEEIIDVLAHEFLHGVLDAVDGEDASEALDRVVLED